MRGSRRAGVLRGRGSLSEELLEEALLLGLVVEGARRCGALLRGRLVGVGVTADEVHRALDVCEHLNLLHLQSHRSRSDQPTEL